MTSTAVITVYPVASETPTGSEKGTEAQNHVKAIGSVCAAQVTVTVPGPEVTVTVVSDLDRIIARIRLLTPNLDCNTLGC